MGKRYFFAIVFSLTLIIGAVVLASASDIQYPVKELGNCASEANCKTYCDKPANAEACLNFAEQYNLMSAEEIQAARKFLAAGSGPGGCASKDSCETYCNSVDHMNECVAYAEKNNLMSPQELANSKKVLAAIKAGATPPPCNGKEECDAYCSQQEHLDVCINFSVAAGLMTSQEAEMIKKTGGKGPGGCRSKEECDAFCHKDENMMTCADFAYQSGMMSKDDYEMMKKTGGKGPGGCKSKEECESFCQDPANQQTCFDFAKANGLISREDIQQMEQGKQQFKEAMQNIPPEIYTCLESTVGADNMAKFKSGEAMPPKEIGDKMKECFEKNMPQQQGNMQQGEPGEGGNMPPAGGGQPNMAPGTTGPGDCASPEECQNFQEPQQGPQNMMPNQPGQMPAPCQGENCPPPQFTPGTGPNQQGQMPPAGQMPPSGSEATPPPPAGGSTAPGAGGEITPGVQVPLAPPAEQTAPAPSTAPAPAPTPTPEPTPSSYLQYSPFGAILNFFLGQEN